MTLAVEVQEIGFSYRGTEPVLDGVSFGVEAGETLAILGPNGSGKSTLLKTVARLLKPGFGTVSIDGKPARSYSAREFARRVAFLPQSPTAPPGVTVRGLVAYGRYSHTGPLGRLARDDFGAVDAAIERCELGALADRLTTELSGGERQRAWIAMALAQRAPILLLDEPVTALDVHHQLDVLALIEELNADEGLTVVAVMHDLEQTARHFQRALVMAEGTVAAHGEPRKVLRPDLLRRVFGVDGRWAAVEGGGEALRLERLGDGAGARESGA